MRIIRMGSSCWGSRLAGVTVLAGYRTRAGLSCRASGWLPAGRALPVLAIGAGVRYLGSIFVARQEYLLSLFAADGPGTVQAVSQASFVPFASIEPAVELPGPDLR